MRGKSAPNSIARGVRSVANSAYFVWIKTSRRSFIGRSPPDRR